MSRRWLLSLLCLLCLVAVILFVRTAGAIATLQVNESTTSILIEEQRTVVSLVVANSLGANADAIVRLELVDPADVIHNSVVRRELIKPGTQTTLIPFHAFSLKDSGDFNRFLWYRLRYTIVPADSAAAQFGETRGSIAVGEITPAIFRLNITTPRDARPGLPLRVRARAVHPITQNPIKDVRVSALLELDRYDEEDLEFKQSAITGADGFAVFDFNLPREVNTHDADLTITGERGVLKEEVSADIDLTQRAYGMLNTDKTLYQPGQTLHSRLMVFDASRHALANKEVAFKITDPDGEAVFRASLTTSRFGIASTDWVIPENTKLGDYTLYSTMEDDAYESAHAVGQVKISRYDLPNFSVSVKPDRSFYTAGLDAEVEVRADYLFGQPVKRGRVRVVHEKERRWDYHEQKWDTKEGEEYTGETDAEGRFVARIKLAEAHGNLAGEDYSRFHDLSYAAYFTDPTTNRTEQRRFDLRITKESIHVYVIQGALGQQKDFPLEFYLTTFYADGTPAKSEVTVSANVESLNGNVQKDLRTISTNRLGVAKLSDLKLAPGIGDTSRLVLNFAARDANGKAGRHSEVLYYSDRPVIRLHTDKTLYRSGDPIRVNISSSRPDMLVVVDAAREGKVLRSELVQLVNGHSSLRLPFHPEFRNEITLTAYSASERQPGDETIPNASRRVLFPHDNSLRLNGIFSQETYRPGEEASVNFLTRLANGGSMPTALGVVVFDKAVEERARTDSEFGGRYGFTDPYFFLQTGGWETAGITRKDLDQLNLRKPVPDGWELVAELMLNSDPYPQQPEFFVSNRYETNPANIFGTLLKDQFRSVNKVLNDAYEAHKIYPSDEATLLRLLAEDDVRLEELRDPWDMPYRQSFHAEGPSSVLEIKSSGPDERFNSADDFTALRVVRPYFRFAGEAIDRAVVRYHARTGGFIRDAATLKSELLREGVEFETLRDPWGEPYHLDFGVEQSRYLVTVHSGGPDQKFQSLSDPDGFSLWTSRIDYSIDLKVKLDQSLRNYFKTTSQFPQDDTQLNLALKRFGIERSNLIDPWGNSFYSVFKKTTVHLSRAELVNAAKHGEQASLQARITPVTDVINHVYLRSNGPDGVMGSYDDFDVTNSSRLAAQEVATSKPPAGRYEVTLSGASGAITGIITDPLGAVIPGVTVTATDRNQSLVRQVFTDDNGVYLFKNLPAGIYEIRADQPSFKSSVISQVRVSSSNITTLNLSLDVGAITEAVAITDVSASTLNTMTRSAINSVTVDGAHIQTQTSTPRLREYFPETLVWQPAIETDSRGRASLKFKLADNITTWKMSVIGSTEDGQIGTFEKEIRAFQPFFVEHEPPRILTEGDEISLPVVVRNYLERPQPVHLSIKPEDWFSLLGPSELRANVPAGDATRETFDFRTTSFVKDGKQRITAIAAEESDAIEKPVTVHPDGQELIATVGNLLGGDSTLEFDLSEEMIPNSARGELKIYPGLLGHVVESVEGIMGRPYGCGEQTISSTFPSLLLVRNFKQTGQSFPSRARAERYLEAGYERLLNYREFGGGFSYWGRGDADLALTAYALRFLTEARGLVAVDDDVIIQTRQWLIQQQRPDGSWSTGYSTSKDDGKRRNALTTAYITRVLAATDTSRAIAGEQPLQSSAELKRSLKKALDYLSISIAEIREPYLLAAFALAALDSGDQRAEIALTKLRSLATTDRNVSYWSLETNTPFNGWGTAGRIETTALVVQALARAQRIPKNQTLTPPVQSIAPHTPTQDIASQTTNDQLIRSGLLFLLGQKDRYGVWHSTQATINVLDSLLAVLTGRTANERSIDSTADVLVNGRLAQSVPLPGGPQLVGPVLVDVSRFLQGGRNRVEIRSKGVNLMASTQLVVSYYVPWTHGAATAESTHHASGLRLVAKFDKTEAAIGEEITCHVEAARMSSTGYGMLLAEIGLPPGADVDRASLETAMKNSDWAFSQYDILPDRVVMYLWPRTGGTSFDFKFRPRFGLRAKAASSVVYDYYNPEARVVLQPELFVVR